MKKVLIASFDLEVGGVERSLISMLNNFDYERHQVDMMLYRHSGDFIHLLSRSVHLLEEVKAYKTFRLSIRETIKSGALMIALVRIFAKYRAQRNRSPETGYRQMQYMWRYSLPFLPKSKKQYDIAISYLWPHYYVADKVKAKQKIAWIHTDFSTVDTDKSLDLAMWEKFDLIVAVSDDCKSAFIKKYPALKEKIIVIENITSPEMVRSLAEEVEACPLTKDERFKLITVARYSYAKGLDQAIFALKKLKDKGYTNIAWYLVGYGEEEEKLKQLVSEQNLEDSFLFIGKKTNPYPFMKEADLYVQPSRYEGKAVTVSEAQILGKPVLITNYPTAKSQVQHGVDGYICDLSVNGIVDGIEQLYTNHQLRNSLGTHCKRVDFQNSSELEKLYDVI